MKLLALSDSNKKRKDLFYLLSGETKPAFSAGMGPQSLSRGESPLRQLHTGQHQPSLLQSVWPPSLYFASPVLLPISLARSDEGIESQTNLESDGAFGLCTRNRANGELITGSEVLPFGISVHKDSNEGLRQHGRGEPGQTKQREMHSTIGKEIKGI